MMNRKLIVLLIFLIIGVAASSIAIGELSKNGRTIPVNIIVENANPTMDENVRFRLVLGADYPFYISELSGGGGIDIVRIPDDVDPTTISKDPNYLSSLQAHGTHATIGLKDYSNDNKSLLLEWDCTVEVSGNPLMEEGGSKKIRAPAGNYIIFKCILTPYGNDNKLEFRTTDRSIFHLDGLCPSIHSRYEPSNKSIDVEVNVTGGIADSNKASLSIGVYVFRDDKRLAISPRYDESVALGAVVKKHYSDIDARENEFVIIYALVQYEGHNYSLSDQLHIKQVIE